jgi:hypothetical protein
MGKLPYFEFYSGDWMKDPRLALCSSSTRGIWVDFLCAMHEDDRSGQITGTPEQLSRLSRCTAVELIHAIDELNSTKTANVTNRNGFVTIINRRMKREYDKRKSIKIRVDKHRSKGIEQECNASETPYARAVSSSSSVVLTPPVSKETSPPGKPGGGSSHKISNRKRRKRNEIIATLASPDVSKERWEKVIASRAMLLKKRTNDIVSWWATMKKKIEEGMNPQSFNAFIEPLEAIEKTGNKLILLSFPDTTDWVREHYLFFLSGEIGMEVQIIDGTEG